MKSANITNHVTTKEMQVHQVMYRFLCINYIALNILHINKYVATKLKI